MARRQPSVPAAPLPWDPVFLELRELSAIKAMDPVAFEALLKICGVDRNTFIGGGEDGRRATDFACGKTWVGHSLRAIRAMKMPGPKPTSSGPHAVPIGAPPQT